MATTAVTTNAGSTSLPPSVVSSPTPATAPGSPTRADFARVGVEAAAESNSSVSAPESTASASAEHSPSGAASPDGELSPQDFGSLEDYAQALIEKKQSAVSTQQSATPDSDAVTEDLEDSGVADREPVEVQNSDGADQDAERLAEQDQHPVLDLDAEEFLSTKGLNDKINANAALKQALEADQPLRNAMFRNARLASEAAGYKEIFPDLDSARYAADQAATFAGLDHAFLNAGSKQGAEQFLSHWAQMALLTDENGNVLRDQTGNPQMHSAWSSVNQHIFDSQLDFVRKKAERSGDHELVAALDVIRESVSPSLPATDELPPHLQAAAESINRREQELTRQQLMQQERAARAFEDSVGEAASEKINALVQPALEKAALSDFVRQTAREKIENAIVEGLGNNRFFQSRMAELSRFPASEEARQQRLNLIMTHVQALAGPIVRQVLREASQPVIKAQEDRRAKIESQIARTRSEPRSVGGAALQNGTNQTPEQILATAKTQLRDELGDEPSMQQVIERFARLRRTSY